MLPNNLLSIVAQGLPEGIVPGETDPNLVVSTGRGTLVLYILNEVELWLTTGRSVTGIHLCGRVWVDPYDGERFGELNMQGMGQAFKGLYTGFFAEMYEGKPEISGSFNHGADFQTEEQAEGAAQLLLLFLSDAMPSRQAEELAMDFWDDFAEEVGPIGDLSIWEDALGDDDDDDE